mmetsp:Transcript_28187/g.74505  ORF Transcript_28187/g.74505 Transcript_28187/m.74505 type:complete len:127 (+) Transcript_28187:407-787(+)
MGRSTFDTNRQASDAGQERSCATRCAIPVKRISSIGSPNGSMSSRICTWQDRPTTGDKSTGDPKQLMVMPWYETHRPPGSSSLPLLCTLAEDGQELSGCWSLCQDRISDLCAEAPSHRQKPDLASK